MLSAIVFCVESVNNPLIFLPLEFVVFEYLICGPVIYPPNSGGFQDASHEFDSLITIQPWSFVLEQL